MSSRTSLSTRSINTRCALGLLLPLLGACTSVEPIRHDDRLQAWLEFTSIDTVAAQVADAAELFLDLRVAVIQGQHDAAFVRAACAAADEHDVALILWPLLDPSDGYWPNQGNAPAFAAWTLQLADAAPKDCPRLDGFVVDMEMPIDRAETLSGVGLSLTERITALVDGADPVAFEAARGAYTELVGELHARGLRVFVSSLPMLIDDELDGDEGIAHALWTPVQDIPWDRASFQVYRTLFAEYATSLLGTDDTFGPGLVTSYAEHIEAFWGDAASIDLGTTGAGVVEHGGMEAPAELQEDIAAALAAGIPLHAINVYSLEGLLEHDDPAAWVRTPSPAEGAEEQPVESIRNIIQGLDELL